MSNSRTRTATPTTKKNIYLFFGEDNYSSHQKLLFWKNAFIQKHDDTNLETIEPKKLDPAQFKNDIETLPFLADKRLIIIKNIFQESKKSDLLEKISNALDHAADFSIILFYENTSVDKRLGLFKKIKKLGNIEEFPALTPQQISKWILQKAQKENININYSSANYLSQHCKPNLWTINNELDKLKLHAQGQEITTTMIEKLVPMSLTSSIFKLTDSITTKNRKQALETLEILHESGEGLSKIFYMIARHFRILIQVNDLLKSGLNAPQISKKMKIHSFVAQKTSQQSKNFNDQKLKKIYKDLLTIDIHTKTGVIRSYQGDDRQFKLALNQFILNCCA